MCECVCTVYMYVAVCVQDRMCIAKKSVSMYSTEHVSERGSELCRVLRYWITKVLGY